MFAVYIDTDRGHCNASFSAKVELAAVIACKIIRAVCTQETIAATDAYRVSASPATNNAPSSGVATTKSKSLQDDCMQYASYIIFIWLFVFAMHSW